MIQNPDAEGRRMAENRIRGTPGNSRPGWWAGCKQPGCIYGQDDRMGTILTSAGA